MVLVALVAWSCIELRYAQDESNQEGHMPPFKYAPDEIRKSMFLPLIGGRYQI